MRINVLVFILYLLKSAWFVFIPPSNMRNSTWIVFILCTLKFPWFSFKELVSITTLSTLNLRCFHNFHAQFLCFTGSKQLRHFKFRFQISFLNRCKMSATLCVTSLSVLERGWLGSLQSKLPKKFEILAGEIWLASCFLLQVSCVFSNRSTMMT